MRTLKNKRISERYALALVAGLDSEQLNNVSSLLSDFLGLLADNRDLIEVLGCRAYSKTGQQGVVSDLFQKIRPQLTDTQLELWERIEGLTSLLVDGDRFFLLSEIEQLVIGFKNKSSRVLSVEVTTSRLWQDAERREFEGKLNKLCARETRVEIRWQENSALIDGLILSCGDFYFDGSLAGRLAALKHTLKGDGILRTLS